MEKWSLMATNLKHWKHFESVSLEKKVEDMASRTNNLWNQNNDNKVLTTENNNDKIETAESSEQKQKENDMSFDMPDLPLEGLTAEATDTSVEDESGGSLVYGILGSGQAGGRLAESFYGLGYKKCLAVNTAVHDLDGLQSLPENQKVLMKTATASGAGKDMRVGEEAADKAQQEIYEKMQKLFGKVDRILVCAGAGGGTGGGSCLRLVDTAKKYLTYLGVEDASNKVGVLVTLPTAGEAASPTVAQNAYLLVTKLAQYAQKGDLCPLIIFDNDKINKMYSNLTVNQFWPAVNQTVTNMFHSFNKLSTQVGNPTSFDPADYSRVLSAPGCLIMGVTTVQQYKDGADVSKAMRQNLSNNLLCGGFDLSTAKAAACIAVASQTIFNSVPGLMNSLEAGFDTLANLTGNATVFRGIYEGSKEKLSVFTMVSGLQPPQKRFEDLNKFKTVSQEKMKLF
jgi:cell division GTPase FtsZ